MGRYEDIYAGHAAAYDELVRHEDHEGNLARFLLGAVQWDGKRVLEPGAGTGRVTAIYQERAGSVLLADRSAHMLDVARARFGSRVRFAICENLALASLGGQYDVVIEGWSFGHTVTDGAERLEETVDALVAACLGLLAPGGAVVLIETLGSGVAAPGAPNETLRRFYQHLEERHGFARTTLSTEYRFASAEEAARITGFFFGPEFSARVRSRDVPEFTGVWLKRT